MRLPAELDHHELRDIVSALQSLLYLDENDVGQTFWNPDKVWAGAEILDQVAETLASHGLTPENPQRASTS